MRQRPQRTVRSHVRPVEPEGSRQRVVLSGGLRVAAESSVRIPEQEAIGMADATEFRCTGSVEMLQALGRASAAKGQDGSHPFGAPGGMEIRR